MLDFSIEKNLFDQGSGSLGSLDEAGRGPLAGPVVAACAVCDGSYSIPSSLKGVRDSKQLTEKKREALYDGIMGSFLDVGVGICDNFTIDRINILQASFLAMKKAISMLKVKPEYILIDGNMTIPNSSLKQRAIVKGDSIVFSIAAASIIAKVTRDKLMKQYHDEYPQYGFDRNKGYGTKKHFDSLNKYGPCRIHRRSFAPVRKYLSFAPRQAINIV